jgi:hypothetical protein
VVAVVLVAGGIAVSLSRAEECPHPAATATRTSSGSARLMPADFPAGAVEPPE